MRPTFEAIRADGIIETDSPKLDALKYTAWLNLSGIGYSMTAQDGRYTVAGDGCQTLTFVQSSGSDPITFRAERRASAAQTLARYGEG